MKNTNNILVETPEGKYFFGRNRHRYEDNIKIQRNWA
jgi:hypothetical protein